MAPVVKRFLGGLLHSRWAKLLSIVLISGMVATASATVYVFYYGNGTATVQTSDMRLAPGTDASASCTAYPCATVTVSSTKDIATIGLSFFPATTDTPTPATYYTNITTIQNHGAGSHTIQSVKVFNIVDSSSSLGSITVYYCTTQTEFNPAGTLVTPSNCPGSFSITSSTGGTVVSSQTLAAGAKGYVEIVAYAKSTATAGSAVTFSIAFQWL